MIKIVTWPFQMLLLIFVKAFFPCPTFEDEDEKGEVED